MKIIKQGVIPSKAVYFGACINCHCEVECYESELSTRALGSDQCSYKIVHCPTECCCREITMTPKMEI